LGVDHASIDKAYPIQSDGGHNVHKIQRAPSRDRVEEILQGGGVLPEDNIITGQTNPDRRSHQGFHSPSDPSVSGQSSMSFSENNFGGTSLDQEDNEDEGMFDGIERSDQKTFSIRDVKPANWEDISDDYRKSLNTFFIPGSNSASGESRRYVMDALGWIYAYAGEENIQKILDTLIVNVPPSVVASYKRSFFSGMESPKKINPNLANFAVMAKYIDEFSLVYAKLREEGYTKGIPFAYDAERFLKEMQDPKERASFIRYMNLKDPYQRGNRFLSENPEFKGYRKSPSETLSGLKSYLEAEKDEDIREKNKTLLDQINE
jgi:hypothetical protein